jgi:hypothetical protein
MSRILLFLILLGSCVLAGERPKGFLGINWGASPEEAKRVLQARPGVKFPEGTDDYKFELTGGTFAGKAVTKWVLEFPDRKFASATVVMKPEDGEAQALYKEFRLQLIGKYGSATQDKKLANKERRVAGERPTSLGNSTAWKFFPNIKEKSNVTITCEMAGPNGAPATSEAQLLISIRYVNETLLGEDAKEAAATAKPKPTGVKKDEL